MTDFRPMRVPVTVEPEEAGQKLLRFLARRFDVPEAAAHRWVRTGQVRVNGGRVKPFTRLEAGDRVRVPPITETGAQEAAGIHSGPGLPPIIAYDSDLIVLAKPAGLPVHPGSGHTDSVTGRLARHFAGAAFVPEPAHRLDADTSGILLVAASYGCLRELHTWFRTGGAIRKEYLAWTAGAWPGETGEALVLRDALSRGKAETGGMERVVFTEGGLESLAEATLVQRLNMAAGPVSLLRVRLFTGRTHQIRAQMSGRGHPVIGDRKYQGPPAQHYAPGEHPPLYLHAAHVVLPDGRTFTCLPGWPEPFSVSGTEEGL